MTPPSARLWAKVDTSGDCWLWTASLTTDGYGQIMGGTTGQRRPVPAHRVAYEELVGPIPEGMVLDHLCVNPPCVNPAHLEVVTSAENIAREYRRRNPTHCRNGHPWSQYGVPSGPAGRRCRRCHADYQNARKHRVMARQIEEVA